jgi:hypothetical protein
MPDRGKGTPWIPTTVVDNFFETPDLIRKMALELEYYKGERGTWPGLRSPMLQEISMELYEVLECKLLEHLPMFKGFDEIQSTFQIIDETWGRGWVHDDNPIHDVAGIIYLTPECPLHSGTTFYKDVEEFNGEFYTEMFQQDVTNENAEERKKFWKYREEQRATFPPEAEVDFLYNRCVMFDPRTWHSANDFFGKTKEDARMTLVFFGNAIR